MDEKIREHFSRYYKKTVFSIPDVHKREFGIGNRKKIDARHLSFQDSGELGLYLAANTPMFVSHSIAYYEFPGATPIGKKQRRGADLVFDLDIHAEGKYGAYRLLDEVKEDALRLADEFITGDFAVDKKYVKFVFSGNRGYHIHVTDPRFRNIGGEERKEIVDYVRGTGLDYRVFFSEESIKERADGPKKLIGPMPDEGGYRGRLARAFIRTLRQEPNVISRKYSKEEERERFISGIEKGNWSATSFSSKEIIKRIKPVADALPVRAVDTDAAVTHDMSKLIRVPDSIHGETGLIAKTITDMESFNPLIHGFPKTDRQLKVMFLEDVPEVPGLDGGTGEKYQKGDIADLPGHIAFFYVLKGSAETSI
jgi:DNA primase small subunit